MISSKVHHRIYQFYSQENKRNAFNLGVRGSPPLVSTFKGIKLVPLCNSWPEKIKKSSMFNVYLATLNKTNV